jgi:hypothetical protein
VGTGVIDEGGGETIGLSKGLMRVRGLPKGDFRARMGADQLTAAATCCPSERVPCRQPPLTLERAAGGAKPLVLGLVQIAEEVEVVGIVDDKWVAGMIISASVFIFRWRARDGSDWSSSFSSLSSSSSSTSLPPPKQPCIA